MVDRQAATSMTLQVVAYAEFHCLAANLVAEHRPFARQVQDDPPTAVYSSSHLFAWSCDQKVESDLSLYVLSSRSRYLQARQ